MGVIGEMFCGLAVRNLGRRSLLEIREKRGFSVSLTALGVKGWECRGECKKEGGI